MRSRAARLATPAVIAALFITTFLAAPVFAIGVGNTRNVVLRTLQALGLTYDSAGSTPISVTSGAVTITGDLTVTGAVLGRASYEAFTASDTLTEAESGKHCVATSGTPIWTLPEITLSGVVFSFKTLGGTARFTPNANDATRWSGGLTADAEPIELGINSAARIISDGGSLWLVEVEQNDIREETP